MKIVIIGAGSYVFAPTVLADAIEKHRIDPLTLALVDVDIAAARTMAALAERMAADCGVSIAAEAFAGWREALPGADFVILCAAVQGARRWHMDFEMLRDAGMPEQARECGGMGGLVNTLRTCTLALDICKDMRDICPTAWLLDATNPMPRVVTAIVKYGGVGAFGFCNIAHGSADGYDTAGRLVGRDPGELNVVTAGLNHFAWLIELTDRKTGENFPAAESHIRESAGKDTNHAVLARWPNEYGAVGMGSVDHIAEWLAPIPELAGPAHSPFHGAPAERDERRALLKAAADGHTDWRPVVHSNGSWEHPADVAAALHSGARLPVDIINLPNNGRIPQLPASHMIEAPVVLEEGVVLEGNPITLPEGIARICNEVSQVHELTVAGAATGNVAWLERAIRVDPAIPAAQRLAAIALLPRLIDAHRDLLPQFAG